MIRAWLARLRGLETIANSSHYFLRSQSIFDRNNQKLFEIANLYRFKTNRHFNELACIPQK